MALTLKILRAGTLSSIATLYPSPDATSNKSALIKNILITNKHASQASTINIYVQSQASGTDVYVSAANISLPAGAQLVLDNEICLYLATGPDRLRGSASGGTVDYVINGLERDV